MRALASVHRRLHCRSSAGWNISAAFWCQQTQVYASTLVPSGSSGDETIMGMIGTSVTKKLWQERLTKNKDRLKHLPLPSPTPKLPQQTSVTYPFSSDRLLQEQARDCTLTISQSALLNLR